MRDRVDIAHLDRPVGKQAQCPFGVALGRFSARHGDDACLDISSDLRRNRRTLPLLSVHGGLQSTLAVTGANLLNRRGRCVEGNGCLLNRHGPLPVLVHGKENMGPQDGPGRHLARLHNLGQLPALGRRQAHLVLLYRHNRIVLSIAQQRYN